MSLGDSNNNVPNPGIQRGVGCDQLLGLLLRVLLLLFHDPTPFDLLTRANQLPDLQSVHAWAFTHSQQQGSPAKLELELARTAIIIIMRSAGVVPQAPGR